MNQIGYIYKANEYFNGREDFMISREWSKVDRRYLRLIGARKAVAIEKYRLRLWSGCGRLMWCRLEAMAMLACPSRGGRFWRGLSVWMKGRVSRVWVLTRIGPSMGWLPLRGETLRAGCRSAKVNATESPLGWLLIRRGKDGKSLISKAQFEAGERLRNDFELAGMSPKVTQGWGGLPMGGKQGAAYRGMDYSLMQLSARGRFNTAVDAMGPGLSDIAVWVCCFMEGLEAAERRLGWPVRSGKLVLGLAFDRLQKHYGI